MQGTPLRPAAALAAILVALLLGACGGGGDSDTTVGTTSAESTESGAPTSGASPNAWNHVNEPLREDILKFGEEGTEAELEEAAAALRGYLDARASEDFTKVCSYLSPYMLSRAKGMAARQDNQGCSAGIESLEMISSASETEGAVEVNPSSIRRQDGPRTFVIFEDEYGDTYAMLMQHEGDSWKIHGFEPTRLS